MRLSPLLTFRGLAHTILAVLLVLILLLVLLSENLIFCCHLVLT